MIGFVRMLWAGELSLGEAFWCYAVGYGLVLNLFTSLSFLLLMTREAGFAWLAFVFLLPIPYNLLVVVGVWRSANRYDGPSQWADLARAGTLVWMAVLTAA